MQREKVTRAKLPEPFPGAKPYEEEDREFFFGREREATEVAERIFRERITILTGESAAGKTSLLRAGVIPLLRGERRRSEPDNGDTAKSPTGQPRAGLALVLRDWGGGKGSSANVLIRSQLQEAIGKLKPWSIADHNLLHERYKKMATESDVASVLVGLADAVGGLILVFDQFEEVLRARKTLARELIETLRRLYQSGSRVRLLLSLREEYHKNLRGLESVVGPLYARTYFLRQMDPPTVEEAIHSAARVANVNISREVVRTLLRWLVEAESGKENAGLFSEEAAPIAGNDPPDLLRIQTVARELVEFSRMSQIGRIELSINQDVLEEYRGNRSEKEIVGKALERWISDSLKLRAPREGSVPPPQITEPAQTALVNRIAARIAPFLSSGDYKVAQEEADLFQRGLREDLSSLLGLEDRIIIQSLAQAIREYGDSFTSTLLLDPEMVERASENLAGVASSWRVENSLREIYRTYMETLARLQARNVVKQLSINGRDVWELVHDGFGRPFWNWAEENRETWDDCRSSLVACRGVSPILITASVICREPLQCLNWRGCLIRPSSQEMSLTGLVFERCDFRGSIFEACVFQGATFRKCILDGTVFRNCHFLCSEKSEEIRFEDCHPNSLGLLGGTVASMQFESCTLRQATFAGLTLAGQLRFTNSALHLALFEDLCSFERGCLSFEGRCEMQYCAWDHSFETLVSEKLPELRHESGHLLCPLVIAARAILGELLQRALAEVGTAAVLTGDVVEDLRSEGVPAACRTKVVEALWKTLRDGNMEARQRAIAGVALASIWEDSRPELMTIDGMELCWVPAGAFLMGREVDGAAANERDEREMPRHTCMLADDFWIGRYPVTMSQFREFVAESRFQPGDPKSLVGCANEPVAWVSWFEAVNFCVWLTGRWRKGGLLDADWEVRLPSEAEWEKAARGGLEIPSGPVARPAGNFKRSQTIANPHLVRRYPWGEEADPNRANYKATGIKARSAAGCFPFGASPHGCEEMSGNVWEWTRTLWGDDLEKPWFRYPYVANDGRESLSAGSNVWRVLRGGAFDDDSERARCAFRIRYPPNERKSGIGFRVAVYRVSE